jgi:hypothetical protein
VRHYTGSFFGGEIAIMRILASRGSPELNREVDSMLSEEEDGEC